MSETFVTCSDCNRCLRTEDGPTCPECMEKRSTAAPQPTPAADAPDSQPLADAMPAAAQDVILLHSIDGHSEQVSA